MLRRKLLIRVGLLICAFVLGAAVAVWKLQDVLAELDLANADAAALVDGVQDVGLAVNVIVAARLGGDAEPSIFASPGHDAATLPRMVERLGEHRLLHTPGEASLRYAALKSALPAFLAAAPATSGAIRAGPDKPAAENWLGKHRLVAELSRSLREFVAAEQVRVGDSFRFIVIALTLAAFVMANAAIFVLLRTAQLVLNPVAALVSGSRELAAENFAHRVEVVRGDEFAELAHAYNSLAEQLQSNEQRRTETLRQLAVTLNHELNNTMSIIELQLRLLDKRSGQDPTADRPLREIRAGLLRMSRTVASLKDIRRIVLVDYAGGQKMIDLERSVAADAPAPAPVVRQDAGAVAGGASR